MTRIKQVSIKKITMHHVGTAAIELRDMTDAPGYEATSDEVHSKPYVTGINPDGTVSLNTNLDVDKIAVVELTDGTTDVIDCNGQEWISPFGSSTDFSEALGTLLQERRQRQLKQHGFA